MQFLTHFVFQKMDFHPSMSELEPPLRLILNTCHDLVTNKSLQDFMAVILQLGNYLNSVYTYLFFFSNV